MLGQSKLCYHGPNECTYLSLKAVKTTEKFTEKINKSIVKISNAISKIKLHIESCVNQI